MSKDRQTVRRQTPEVKWRSGSMRGYRRAWDHAPYAKIWALESRVYTATKPVGCSPGQTWTTELEDRCIRVNTISTGDINKRTFETWAQGEALTKVKVDGRQKTISQRTYPGADLGDSATPVAEGAESYALSILRHARRPPACRPGGIRPKVREVLDGPSNRR